MSQISNVDARTFAALLTAGADQAEAAGQTSFDLTAAAQGKFDAALAEWNAAKADTSSSSGN